MEPIFCGLWKLCVIKTRKNEIIPIKLKVTKLKLIHGVSLNCLAQGAKFEIDIFFRSKEILVFML